MARVAKVHYRPRQGIVHWNEQSLCGKMLVLSIYKNSARQLQWSNEIEKITCEVCVRLLRKAGR